MSCNFPKILFIGAITFEEISGSHSFFYRLFTGYPAEKLMVIGSHKSRNPIFPSIRLPGVNYTILEEYIRSSKFNQNKILFKLQSYYYIIEQIIKSFNQAKQIAKDFAPDLILTLGMDFYWYLAYKISRELDIPLELVLHDHWEPNTDPMIVKYLTPKFKEVFKHARNRFCISPTMEKYYYDKLGLHSDILYPISRQKKTTKDLSIKDGKRLTVVFFGNIWENQPTLIKLAHLLYKKNAELVVFSNRDISFFQEHGLLTPNLTANFFFKEHEELLNWCQQNADILYLPMPFNNSKQEMVRCSFPSKIADYTLLGLPVIIHAPQISSIVEFATINSDYKFAEVVINDSEDELAAAVDALMDAKYREILGRNSINIWHKFFDPAVVRTSFFEKISIKK